MCNVIRVIYAELSGKLVLCGEAKAQENRVKEWKLEELNQMYRLLIAFVEIGLNYAKMVFPTLFFLSGSKVTSLRDRADGHSVNGMRWHHKIYYTFCVDVFGDCCRREACFKQ